VLYGAGEDDSQMHRLWRAAWEGQQPLQLYGEGRNRLPTLHVQDLAACAEAVVLQQPASRYLLACDEEAVSQAELLAAVGQLLGNKQLQ
jgi:adenylate kinase